MKQPSADSNKKPSMFNLEGGKTEPKAIQKPSISVPKGGGAIKGIDEKFSVNAVTGTAAFSIPLPAAPARGVAPQLTLAYNSGNGNGVFGLGWDVELGSIKRKTGQELPQYLDAADSDTYLFAGVEDLVPEFQKEPDGSFTKEPDGTYRIRQEASADGNYIVRYYRPRIEGQFTRIERWMHKTTADIQWRAMTKDNITTLFGWTAEARIADPADGRKVFEWLPEFVFDDQGNCTHYIYAPEDDAGFDGSLPHNANRRKNGALTYTNRYLSAIRYGNKTPYKAFGDAFLAEEQYMFRTVFDYGEYSLTSPYQKTQPWQYRSDAFSDYKPGFEVRTTRLCRRVMLYHHFSDLPGGSALVKSLDLTYDTGLELGFTFLTAATIRGYCKRPDGNYTVKAFPPMEFAYQKHAWNTTVSTIGTEDSVHAPIGIKEPYQFTDLYGEGLSGILTEQGGAWYYKRNLGGGSFARAVQVSPKPSFKGLGSKVYLADLDSDGTKQLVSMSTPPKGYFELHTNHTGPTFSAFTHAPNVDTKDPFTRMIDLTGDGKPDLLITEDQVCTWYESEGRKGYKPARRTPKPFDEEKGPAVVFADSKQTIFLADMDGDGLTDIVRIRAGEVCYWPNMGYGRFGAKVAMDNAPVFDAPDAFNPSYVRLGDIDGSGTTDIVYLGAGSFRCWRNLSGNGFAATPFEIASFPEIHNQADITLADLLGTGTLCIAWSSPLSKDAHAPLRYIDLMSGKKPYVMTAYQNNFGKEVRLTYAPSTMFYLEAERAGRPWVTKLHFPVHCLVQTENIDHVTGQRFVSKYAYHHGYYDHADREFRGFGLVEQTDAEQFDHWVKGAATNVVEQDLHQEPVVKKTWFHTGAFTDKDRILDQFSSEYWYAELTRQGFIVTHNERQLPDARLTAAPTIDPDSIDHLTAEEWQQAARSCKATVLRSEVFAYDAPLVTPTPAEVQRQLTPYSVETKNCHIELLQPKGQNKYAVFLTKESESIAYSYERDTADPRITHTLNLVFDEYGNSLESAQVQYARQVPDGSLPAAVQTAQAHEYITYKKTRLTNDVLSPMVYQLRMPCEDQTYELRGVTKSGDYYVPSDFDGILVAAADVPYHQANNNPPPGTPQKRLIEHMRSTYYKNDVSGPLPLGQLESRAMPYETYQLAYTPQLVTQVYGARVTDAILLEGKFTHSEGDSNWWVRSGTTQYVAPGETVADAANRFFVPISYTDPFGAVTTVTYIGDFTFVASTEDALGNKTAIDAFNYRTLLPARVRDMNDNLSEVLYDELGLVKATAQLGKGAEADDLSGLHDSTTAADEAAEAAFFAAPTSTDLTIRAKALLARASIRVVYDLKAFMVTGKPAAAATITRERHAAELADSPVQLSFEYSGGLGQVVMKKGQAEPGPAKKLVVAADNTYTVTTVDTTPELRWLGSGRTVLNNKGNPVKQYEPYFSVTHQYEDTKELVESGVTPLFYYDALGRELKVVLPDATFSAVTFTSWQQALYDPGDTVKDSDWYKHRVSSLINAELTAEGKDPLKEKLAALASGEYYHTPTVQHFDSLGRGVLQVHHNRVGGADEWYESQAVLDAEGNLRSVIDARGTTTQYRYDMLGRCVYQDSPDGGQRWMLANVMGEALRTWDERGHAFAYSYDLLGRPSQNRVEGGDGDAPLNHIYERIFYGESVPNPKANNLRGAVVQYYDTGGLVETPAYDFKGLPLTNSRTLCKHYKDTPNWTDANLATSLEAQTFTTATVYDALGRVTQTTAPDGSIERTTFNAGGLLETKTVQQGASTDTIVENIDYNEKGKRTRLVLGNGVTTTYRYDRKSFALIRVTSRKANNEVLQDLRYTFDATGNVTHVQDDAVPLQFFNNQMVSGLSTYTYDAVYQLIQATGRENNAALTFGSEDNWNDQAFSGELNIGDPTAIRTYTQTYDYDAGGNLLQIDHQAPGNAWIRDYTYAAGSNRLLTTTIGAHTYTYTHHPDHGFMTGMPHLAVLGWNCKEKLVRTIRQQAVSGTPETTYYQYAANGQRLRKITEVAAPAGETPAKKDERIYVGAYELYKKHSGTHAGLWRHSVSVVDPSGRIAIIETRNDIDDGTDPRTIRYQIANHLGSVSLEVDADAKIISYEEYHPFGTTAYRVSNKAVKATAKHYRYVGMERDDETGLAYHTARYYIPWLGRWLSVDPSGIDDGLNIYRYAKNNPVTLTDTNGNESDEQKASRMFEEFLTEQKVNFKKEVPFRVEVNGKWVEGRADFFVETNSGKWEPVEMKGKANSPWTKAQKEYLPALQSGAKFETIGTSKFSTPVTGSGGGKVFNVHTVAKGKFDFQKLFTSSYIRRPAGDPSKAQKITTTTDSQGQVVDKKVEPHTSKGTRSSDIDKPKAPHGSTPHGSAPHGSPKGFKPKGGGVKGKGLLGGVIVAGAILLFTGDAKAAAQSLNPAADTTEAVIDKKGPAEVAGGVILDIATLIPQVAIVRTGVALNRAAMDASHFPVPEGWVEQQVAKGRNPFCAMCHGEGNLRDKWQQDKENERYKSMLDQFTVEDNEAIIKFLQQEKK